MSGTQQPPWWMTPNAQFLSSITPPNGHGWEAGLNSSGYPGPHSGGSHAFIGSDSNYASINGHFSELAATDQVSRRDLTELRCLIHDKCDALDRKKQDSFDAESRDLTTSERLISLGKNLSALDNTLGSLDTRLSDAMTGTADRIEDTRDAINLIRQEVIQHVRVLETLARIILRNHKDQMESDESELIEGFIAGDEVCEARN